MVIYWAKICHQLKIYVIVRNHTILADFNNLLICYRNQHFEQHIPLHVTIARFQFPKYSQRTVSTTAVNFAYSCSSVAVLRKRHKKSRH